MLTSAACRRIRSPSDLIVENALLIPELQERGYYRDDYEGTTLRENLGLERPGAWDAGIRDNETVHVG